MNLAFPIETAIPSSHGPVLQQLATASHEVTGLQLAELLKGQVGKSRVYQVLEELEGTGLVDLKRVGASKLYSLNREHLVAAPVIELANLRHRFLEKLKTELHTWKPAPAAAFLFGSVAEGTAKINSDVDILLIRPDAVEANNPAWERQVFDFEVSIDRWTGNQAQIIDYSESEWKKLKSQSQNLVGQVRKNGILLFGNELRIWK
jgi:DNA-binding transcriptional ArsR family regulator